MSILCPRNSPFTQNYNLGNHSYITRKDLIVHTYSGQQILMSHCTMVKLFTVPVIDMKEMLISILTDKTLMSNTNFAEGYNILTGDVDSKKPCNQKYGIVHTGDAWLPTRDRYCANPNRPTMPVDLIVFGDKYGTFTLTPIIFTLTLFNQPSRNNTRFWRPIGYIPNLSYGKGGADHRKTSEVTR